MRIWSTRSRDLLNFVDTLRPNREMWSESRSPVAGALDRGWGESTRTIVSGVTGLGVVGLIGTADNVCYPKDVVNRSAKARSVLFYISYSMVQNIGVRLSRLLLTFLRSSALIGIDRSMKSSYV